MSAAAQKSAVRVIMRALKGEHVQIALDKVLENQQLPDNDRMLCADLAYGYLRLQIRLNFILRNILSKPQKLPEDMRIMLGVAVFSLLFQDRVPDYATVHLAVGQIAGRYGKKLAGVANAALRSVQRLGDALLGIQWYKDKMAADDLFAALSVFYGIPAAVAGLWRDAYGGENAIDLMRRSFARPRKAIRINLSHPEIGNMLSFLKTLDSSKVERIGDAAYAFAPGYLSEAMANGEWMEWHRKGFFSWQSAGSLLVLEKLRIFDWKCGVWDCCAGVGGKTCALLERGIEVGVASDLNPRRLKHLRFECGRLHINTPRIAIMDATKPAVGSWSGNIIADVPCSGLGVLARRPDIRRHFHAAPPSIGYADAQSHILKALKKCLMPGRELAYITCTLNPRENEEVVGKFLASEPDMHLIRQWQTPHQHPWLEGMYGAVLGKK